MTLEREAEKVKVMTVEVGQWGGVTEGRSWGDQPSGLPGTEEVSCDSGLSFLLICVHCIYLFSAVLGLPRRAGFSLVAVSGVQGGGLSSRWLLWVWSTGSRAPGFRVAAHDLSSWGSWALEHRLRSGGAGASLPRGLWHLPGAGMEPASPALAGQSPYH